MHLRILGALTGKRNIILTESGDHSINAVLKTLKGRIITILLQDQGGWLTYKDYAIKHGFDIIELKTDYGIIDLKELEANANEKSALLVNSLSGYFAEQPMKEIFEICKSEKCLIINDASGSIGTENAKIGDIILGSFGKDKPVNLNYGGFVATNNEDKFDATFDDKKIEGLKKELEILPQRLQMFEEINKKIKQDLSSYEIIHKKIHGINITVKFNNEKEKQYLINYCKQNNYEYTLGPRQIRVKENAISIEVKRLKSV